MKLKFKATLLLLFALSFLTAQERYLEKSLPLDNNYRIGKLENGLTYYLRKGSNPKGYAEFFIIHNVGSLQEEENQRGLAHFLEHMAFNGTKNFPDKALLNYFAGIGVKFGANINAYTSMDRTVYNISAVPVNLRSTIIDTALLALHDWSYYISCEQEEIDKERGVVREEWRRGDDSRARMMKGINRYVQKGSRYAVRDVIGLMEVVDNFSREELIDYYHKWYRPDLQAIVVVGDIDVDDIESRIKSRFSSIPYDKNSPKKELYYIPDNREPIVGFITDPESKAVSVRLVKKMPVLTEKERESHYAIYYDVATSIIKAVFENRADVMAMEPETQFKTLVPIFGSIYYAANLLTITAIPKEKENTFGALRSLLIELERLTQHGISAQELERAKMIVKRGIESTNRRKANYRNSDYVNEAVEHYTRSQPLLNHKECGKLSLEILDKITTEEINNTISQLITHDNRVIPFAIPESLKETLPTPEEVIALTDSIAQSSFDKFVPISDKQISLEGFNSTVSPKNYKKSTLADSTYQWEFPNGVKVIWKEEANKEGYINMRAFKKGGLATNLPTQELTLMQHNLLNLTVNGLNRNELTKWKMRHKVSLSPSLDYRYSQFNGKFKESDAKEFFSLLHHLFTDVSIDQINFDNLKERIIKGITESKSETSRFRDTVRELKYISSPLHNNFTEEFAASITPQKIEEIYNQIFAATPGYTFIFVGPMAPEMGREFTSKYVGTIAKKEAQNSVTAYKERNLSKGEIALRFQAKGMVSTKATVTRFFHAPVPYNGKNSLAARYVAYILSDRYLTSIREERGGTYYVGVSRELVKYPTATATISIDFDTDPALVDELLEVIQEEIDKLVKSGPTQREVNEVTLYLDKLFSSTESQKDWLAYLSNTIMGEEVIGEEEKSFLHKIGAEDIQKIAKSIFGKGNRMTFVFEPQN
ncbi:MAG: insulinase family protein [Bacteroidales bacterium]